MVASVIGSGLALLLLLHSVINALLLRRPEPASLITESVAVLVPCRNEAANVKELLHSLQRQEGLANYSIFILDDNSSDQTLSLARDHADAKTTVLSGSPLPTGWLGKPYACHQLAQAATGTDVLVFIDADVRLEPTAIAQAVTTMRKHSLALVSPYPHQIAATWSERLLQPLLQWSWIATLPLRVAERSSRESLSAANGQFLVVDGAAYTSIGGHQAICDRVLDDIDLLKAMKNAGHRGTVIDGSEIASCRMYTSWREVEMGYTKWLWAAFGSPITSLFTALFLALTYLVPVLSFTAIGLLGYLFGVTSRLVSAVRTRGRLIDSLLHPLSIALLIYLIGRSWWRKYRGTAVWKERTV